jgi:uncharacterized protein YjbI with pentapeptide repeats
MRRPCVSGSAKVTWTEVDPEAESLTPPRSWTLARPVHDLPVSNISEVRVPRSYAVCILRLYSPNHVEVWNSRKSIYKILHSPGPIGPETPDSPGRVPNPKPYMLWCCIKMRCGEYGPLSLGIHHALAIVVEMAEDKDTSNPEPKKSTKRPPWWKRLWRWTEFGEKSGWEYLQLLGTLAIPVVIAFGTLWFTAQQNEQQRVIEEERARAEQGLENQRAQDAALRAYLDQMNYLLLEKNLRKSEPDSEVRNIARAQTLTVLARLDPTRKEEVMRFLTEADLVRQVDKRPPVIGLSGANLANTEVVEADLSGADLEHALLIDANLIFTNLSGANLTGAILNGADLLNANLTGADLNSARLNEADLRDANLSKARLIWADLRNADLRDGPTGTNLKDADLFQADLSGAEGVTEAELEAEAMSLDCAIMPDGSQRPSGLHGSCYPSD